MLRPGGSHVAVAAWHVCGWILHRVSKNKQNYFCDNYVKLPPNLTIFGTKMANCLKL